MKRFTWWRMEQNAAHNARERWCASCSILHHVKRFMSQPPHFRSLTHRNFGVFTESAELTFFEVTFQPPDAPDVVQCRGAVLQCCRKRGKRQWSHPGSHQCCPRHPPSIPCPTHQLRRHQSHLRSYAKKITRLSS